MINDLFKVKYLDGGRDIKHGFDCWGLVRHVLHHYYKAPLLSEFGFILPRNHLKITDAFNQSKSKFKKTSAVASAVACQFDKNGNLLHVGVCLSSNTILHTGSKTGVRIDKVKSFEFGTFKTEYYIYENLCLSE